VKILFVQIFFCPSHRCYSQKLDSLDISSIKNIPSVTYRYRTLQIKNPQQLDSFFNKNINDLRDLNKTKIVLRIRETNKSLIDTLFYIIQKKYGINTFAYYSDTY
jgi:hypothetical protein